MRHLVIVLVIIYTSTISGQNPSPIVHDPKNNLVLSKVVTEAAATAKKMEKSLEYMRKAEEVIQKVSNNIKAVDTGKEIYGLYGKIIARNKDILNKYNTVKAHELFVEDDINNINDRVMNFLSSAEAAEKLFRQILQDDFFKMDDAQRLSMLREVRDDMQKQFYNINSFDIYLERKARKKALYLNMVKRYK